MSKGEEYNKIDDKFVNQLRKNKIRFYELKIRYIS